MSVRKLNPGQAVRVEFNARIVGMVDKDNPYWYIVEYPDGRQDTVSLARINSISDKSRAVFDIDASIQVFSPRLSAEGAIDLYQWLGTHMHEFQAAIADPAQEDEAEQAESEVSI